MPVDGHTDFRHPGNSGACASLAGDVAAAIGRHWPAISRPGGQRLFDPGDVAHVGCRDDDEHLDEVRATIPLVVPASTLADVVASAVVRGVTSPTGCPHPDPAG